MSTVDYYGEAREIAADLAKIGHDKDASELIAANRGNAASFDHDNTTREPTRQGTFQDAYDEKMTDLNPGGACAL